MKYFPKSFLYCKQGSKSLNVINFVTSFSFVALNIHSQARRVANVNKLSFYIVTSFSFLAFNIHSEVRRIANVEKLSFYNDEIEIDVGIFGTFSSLGIFFYIDFYFLSDSNWPMH